MSFRIPTRSSMRSSKRYSSIRPNPAARCPAATLFLVGDPRQAIYGFRGGDIDTYNRAADDVFRYGGAKYTLTRNFRSAAGMIEAVNLLFSRHASPFASERITLPEISAPAKPELGNRPESALLVAGREDRRPLRITDLPDSDGDACLAAAVEIANALLCDDTLHIPPRGDTPERRLRPGDIAILVKKWSEAYALKPLLAARMIPSVFSNSESVYRSDEARELLTVLAAIAAPERSGEVLAALATGLGGCGLAELLRLGSEEGSNELAEHQTAFARLRREWRPETFIVMFSGLLKYFDIPARFARQEGGERKLANLHQLGDLLQQESSRRKLSINALLNFLSDAVEGRIDDSSDEVKQILESDRDSVKITTVHSSKGLEYPVVILPSLFHFATGSRSPGGNFHEDGHLVYELHAAGSMNEREHDEATMENLRLAYVALTRAKYRCHVLWGKDGASSYCNSPLDWLVKFREATPEEAAHPTRFLKMRKDAPRLLPVELEEKTLPVSTQVYRPELDRSRQLAPWEWNHRVLRDHYRIASFSSLSPAASGRLDPADDGADHDDSQPEEQLPALSETAPEKNPALALPGGKAFGNAVHEILEELDFTAPFDTLRELAARKLRFYGLLAGDGSGADRERLDAVAAMVERTRRAPLHDAQGDGFTLSQIGRADRLSELRFLFGFGQKFRHRRDRGTARRLCGAGVPLHRLAGVEHPGGRRLPERLYRSGFPPPHRLRRPLLPRRLENQPARRRTGQLHARPAPGGDEPQLLLPAIPLLYGRAGQIPAPHLREVRCGGLPRPLRRRLLSFPARHPGRTVSQRRRRILHPARF